MLRKVWGAGVHGTEGFPVCCEADVENGFPQFTFIGSLTGAVRESGDRVRTAISNIGIYLEPKHIIINLSPADIRKEGNGYDLPIAAALLASYGIVPDTLLEDSMFAGELSLGGEILPVNGHDRRGTYVPSHLHLNVTYLAIADPEEPIRTKPDENSGVRWAPLEDAIRLSTEPWIRTRIYRKLIDKLA